MPPPKTAKPPSYRTAAAAAGLHQRRTQQQLQLQAQQLVQMPLQQQLVPLQQQLMQAPPGYAFAPIAPPPPPAPPVVANAGVAPPKATASFQCRWAGCRAAQSCRPTLGNLPHCFACLRPKNQALSPPAGKVAPQQQHQPQKQHLPQSTPSAPSRADAQQPRSAAQKRADKRQRQRLAKAAASSPAKANQSPAALAAAALEKVSAAAPPPPRQEGSITAEVFQDKKSPAKRVQVDSQLQDSLPQLSHLAALIAQSIQAEFLPADLPATGDETAEVKEARLRAAAEKVLDETLAKEGSSSLSSSLALQKAEAELAATTRSLQPLLDAGLPPDDQIVKLLNEKRVAQTAAISKLKAGAPSVAAQKVALAVGKQKLLEQQTLLEDRVANGKEAARERGNVRDQLLAQITAVVDRLAAAVDAADGALVQAHHARAEKRKLTLLKAVEICHERELALEEVVFVDANDGTSTSTEQERDTAVAAAADQKALKEKLQHQLDLLQQAAAAAAAKTAPQQQQQLQQQPQSQPATLPAASDAEAQAAADWLLDFPAEEAQVPRWAGAPDEQQTAYLLRLLTMKQAAKFANLPRMTFQQLQVEPWFIHRLVGDTIWTACWAERAPNITADMSVPQKLLNVATHVVAALDNDFRDRATDEHRKAAERTIAEQLEAQRKRARVNDA